MSDRKAEAFRPADSLSITSLETLKVIADPLRQQLIDLLRREPATVKQLAAALNVSPKKLYYHVNLLLEHGLIRVVATRMVSGILERQYRATAYIFILDDCLPNSSPTSEEENRDAVLSAVLQITRDDVRSSIRAGLLDPSKDAPLASSLLLEWMAGHMRPEDAEAFYKRLQSLAGEFPSLRRQDEVGEDERAYRLLITLFPTGSHTPSST